MESKKKFRINIFDIVILAVVVIVGAGFYLFTHREVVQETKTISYTLEITEVPVGFSENIKPGDKITDSVKNYYMGNVVEVDAQKSTRIVDDYETGRKVEAVVPGKETVILTLETSVIDTAANLTVESGYVVKAGKEANIKGPGYAGTGYILTVNREAE
ncbi:MAG: DUF4330 family protein [Clostridiales bacterium]|nr:DUF4330 family protein [Clostridiales bacterium]